VFYWNCPWPEKSGGANVPSVLVNTRSVREPEPLASRKPLEIGVQDLDEQRNSGVGIGRRGHGVIVPRLEPCREDGGPLEGTGPSSCRCSAPAATRTLRLGIQAGCQGAAPSASLSERRVAASGARLGRTRHARALVWDSASGGEMSDVNRREQDLPGTFKAFVGKFPEIADAHEAIARAVEGYGPLDGRMRELIKIGIAIGAGHETATRSHVRRALEQGATEAEIEQAVLLAMNTCGFPRTVMAWQWARRQIDTGGAPVR
jgi:4-carboxymuconolactone decarboxylase